MTCSPDSDLDHLKNTVENRTAVDTFALYQEVYDFGNDSLSASGISSGLSNNSTLHRQSCEALSSSGHQCFWNPQSRITGDFCNTCHKSCQSEQKSMNFYQFVIGVLLISLASPLGFVYIPAIT